MGAPDVKMVQVKSYGSRKKGDRFEEKNRHTAAMLVLAGMAQYEDGKDIQQADMAPKKRRKRRKSAYNNANMGGQLETK